MSTIKLRRSATPGNVPTTAQLALGELAINTYDGKLYLKKDDGTESIVDITATAGGGISNLVQDLTPQLGGDLDLNSSDITGTGNIDITGDITASGSVGIGTSSPAAVLEIDAGSQVGTHLQITTTGSGHNFDMVDGSSTARIRNVNGRLRLAADQSNEAADSGIDFLVDGSEKMRIDSSGNVGIGTTNPRSRLHVYGAGQNTANITDAGNQAAFLRVSESSTTVGSGGGIIFASNQSDDTGAVGMAAIKGLLVSGNTNTIGDLAFSLRANVTDTALTERMRIDSSGNVGIGTISPSEALDVTGNISLSGGISANSSFGTSGQVLTSNGTIAYWADASGSGGGTPGGSDTQIQFNSSGSFAGSSDLTWNGTLLTTAGLFTSSDATFTGEVFFLDDASFLPGSTTRNVFNTTATTINAFGAATTLTMGATTGTTTIRNDLSVTGDLSLSADPTTSLQAATKQYVDTIAAAGIHYHDPVRVERPDTDGNLNGTYNNGSSGVGATLTNAGTQEALVIDGVTLNTNDRVLIYNQTNGYENGVYTVTNTGSGSTNWVLTRATDADSYSPSDPESLGQGDAFFVREGNTGAGELYVMNTSGAITFGTTDITFTEVAATAVYQAGTGLTLNGVTFSTNQDISTTASPTFVNLTATSNIIVTGTVDGRDVATDGTKLDGIEAGAQVNVGTNLGNSADGTSLTITSSTGNDTNLPAATTSAWGVMTDEDKTKLDGIETGADVTDAGNVNPLVDAHLNTSTAATNQVLSWTGSDYDWVDQSGGGGGVTTGKAIAMAIVFG